MIRSPHTDSDFFRPRNPPPPVAPQNVESCCIWDSVQSVEQPCLGGGALGGLRSIAIAAENFASTTLTLRRLSRASYGVTGMARTPDLPEANLVAALSAQSRRPLSRSAMAGLR